MWLIILIAIIILIGLVKDYYPLLLVKFLPPTKNDVSIDSMDGVEFEKYCAKLLVYNGYTNVKTTKTSGDHGIDILATKDDLVYAIQCKCYSKNVGNSAVQEAYTGRELYNANYSVVMTNRYFSPQAQAEAKRLGVLLWDRDTISSFQMKSPISFEKEYDEPEQTEDTFEVREKLYPPGLYIVGETIEPGQYLLRCSGEMAVVAFFKNYDDYKNRDYLNVRNFTDDYTLYLRDEGECIDIECCYIERKL